MSRTLSGKSGGKDTNTSIIAHAGKSVDIRKIPMLNLEENPDMVGKLLDMTSKTSLQQIQTHQEEIVAIPSSGHTINSSWVAACLTQQKAIIVADIYTYKMARVLQTQLQLDRLPENVKSSLAKYLRDSFNPSKKLYLSHLKNEIIDVEARGRASNAFSQRMFRCVNACVEKIEAAVRDNV